MLALIAHLTPPQGYTGLGLGWHRTHTINYGLGWGGVILGTFLGYHEIPAIIVGSVLSVPQTHFFEFNIS